MTVAESLEDTLEKVRDALEDADAGRADERLGLYIAATAANLLDGKRAGAGVHGHPALAKFTPAEKAPPRSANQT